jgi:aerobic-type carbon monoxide dehydrogenase small subunit (CoxS/CutS family)
MRTITLNVNGANYNVNVEPRSMLVDVLREEMGLIATKRPCNRMSCGGCTVLIDGVPHEACTIIALRMVGHSIMTGEIAKGDPVVNALQQAWVTEDGGQCTFCGPGQIMAATALLKSNPNPTIPEIKAALSGNLCRCGNYMHIISAVQAAAASL